MLNWKTNISEAYLNYFFGVLFIQLIELFLPIGFSKLAMIYLLVVIIINIIDNKIKMSLKLIFFEMFCLICLLIYYFLYYDNFVNAYPAIIVAAIWPLLSNNLNFNNVANWRKYEYYTILYLLINLVLYTLNLDSTIQLDGGLRFKGALPHANMLGGILLAILIMFIKFKTKKSLLIKLLSILLLLLNGSRTYILCGIAILIMGVLLKENNNKRLLSKFFVAFVPILVLLQPIWNILMQNTNILYRFNSYSFSNNGRSILSDLIISSFAKASNIEKIFGFEMGLKYLYSSPTYFGHSFGENSYLSTLMLFGISGLFMLVYTFIKFIKKSDSFSEIIVIMIIMVSFFLQDTILTTQISLGMFGSLLLMVTKKKVS